MSWLKGQALPAWQAPCRKNLQGTWEVSAGMPSAVETLYCSRQREKSANLEERESQKSDSEVAESRKQRVGGWKAHDHCGQEQRAELTWRAPRPVESVGSRDGGHHSTGAFVPGRDGEAATAVMSEIGGSGHFVGGEAKERESQSVSKAAKAAATARDGGLGWRGGGFVAVWRGRIGRFADGSVAF